jgi:hypothetical protein
MERRGREKNESVEISSCWPNEREGREEEEGKEDILDLQSLMNSSVWTIPSGTDARQGQVLDGWRRLANGPSLVPGELMSETWYNTKEKRPGGSSVEEREGYGALELEEGEGRRGRKGDDNTADEPSSAGVWCDSSCYWRGCEARSGSQQQNLRRRLPVPLDRGTSSTTPGGNGRTEVDGSWPKRGVDEEGKSGRDVSAVAVMVRMSMLIYVKAKQKVSFVPSISFLEASSL